jgi:hypothetical protein
LSGGKQGGNSFGGYLRQRPPPETAGSFPGRFLFHFQGQKEKRSKHGTIARRANACQREMKKAFAQVVKAQKDGMAAPERARAETAALRSLANATRTMDGNPNLLQFRTLQALADSSGNTLVLGLPNGALPVIKQGEKSTVAESKEEASDS